MNYEYLLYLDITPSHILAINSLQSLHITGIYELLLQGYLRTSVAFNVNIFTIDKKKCLLTKLDDGDNEETVVLLLSFMDLHFETGAEVGCALLDVVEPLGPFINLIFK